MPEFFTWTDLILVAASFVTAAITAVLGMSGGLVLLAVMTLVLPPQIVIPLHGFIIGGNNLQRATIMREHVQWQYVLPVLIGGIVGALIAVFLIKELPEQVFQILLGVGILALAWIPKSKLDFNFPGKWWGVSTLTGFLGMIIGAGSILLHTVLKRLNLNKHQFVATTGAFAASQHIPKVVFFAVFLEFPFIDYALTLIMMLFAGFLGIRLGGVLLEKIPERAFNVIIKTVITILGLRLILKTFFDLPI